MFAGALFGFALARLQFLDFNGIFCSRDGNGTAPGECFFYQQDHYKIGIRLHLATILPASLLAVLQYVIPLQTQHITNYCIRFLPVIRHRALLFHRLNGYLIIVLVVISIAGMFTGLVNECAYLHLIVGALMTARVAFGGGLDVQSGIGMLAIMVLVALAMSYVSIKRLRIDKHRAWMLRAWFYVSHPRFLSTKANANAVRSLVPSSPSGSS